MFENVGELNVRVGIEEGRIGDASDTLVRLNVGDLEDVFLSRKGGEKLSIGSAVVEHRGSVETYFILQPFCEGADAIETTLPVLAYLTYDSSIGRFVKAALFVV
jgi:hypothetical protein